jgi:hypothetical protein
MGSRGCTRIDRSIRIGMVRVRLEAPRPRGTLAWRSSRHGSKQQRGTGSFDPAINQADIGETVCNRDWSHALHPVVEGYTGNPTSHQFRNWAIATSHPRL